MKKTILILGCLLPLLMAATWAAKIRTEQDQIGLGGTWTWLDDTQLKWGNGNDVTFQYDEDGLDAGQWTGKLYGAKKLIEVASDSTETVTAAKSGMIFVTGVGNGSTEYTLPTAASGLIFTFIDVSNVAGDEVSITAASGDGIGGGAAANTWRLGAQTTRHSITLVAISSDSWEIKSSQGTNLD